MVRDLAGAFERAVAAVGPIERWLLVAGRAVRLRFAGPALADRVLPALAHAEIPSQPVPALSIDLFDSASTGTAFDVGIDRDQAAAAPGLESGAQWLITGERTLAAYHGASGALSVFDAERPAATWWIADAASVPWFERAAPMRTIFHWWLRGRGIQLLHAAAVDTPHGGVLLAGRGGTGKSTAALACAAAGLGYVGDDYCLLEAGRVPRVLPLFSSAKVSPDMATRFPRLAAALAPARRLDGPKTVYFMQTHPGVSLSAGCDARALVFPRVADRAGARFVPLTAARAFAALAPSTIFQLPGASPDEGRRIANAVRSLPAFSMEVGPELETLPEAIVELLSTLPSPFARANGAASR